MPDPLRLAEKVRDACLHAAMDAYEQAGISGLYQEGRWELALQEIRSLDLQSLIDKVQEMERKSTGSSGPPAI
jgi:hypothetical protein